MSDGPTALTTERPRLEVRGATVHFGTTVALEGVDVTVAPGEIVAVLGASGSGKSTLLRAVAGLQRLAAGSVELDGRDMAGVAPHRRGVGLMFQDHALFPHRDVRGNVAFGLRMQGRAASEIDARVAELLDIVGLSGMGERAIQTLSGGEQQRVALARALAPRPRLLLLDEPLGALDRDLRERLVAELQRLFRQLGLTVVAVTHDQSEAFTLADRIVVMEAGRLVRSGTPAQIWSDPQVVPVARLLGFGNVVSARVDGAILVTPWGSVPAPHGATGEVTALVRPTGVHLDGAGPGAGTVTARAFRGERSVITIEVPGAPPLEADVATSHAPAMGDPVRFSLDPHGISILRSVATIDPAAP